MKKTVKKSRGKRADVLFFNNESDLYAGSYFASIYMLKICR